MPKQLTVDLGAVAEAEIAKLQKANKKLERKVATLQQKLNELQYIKKCSKEWRGRVAADVSSLLSTLQDTEWCGVEGRDGYLETYTDASRWW